MNDIEFIKEYLNRYNRSLFETDMSDQLIEMKDMLLKVKKMKKRFSSLAMVAAQQ